MTSPGGVDGTPRIGDYQFVYTYTFAPTSTQAGDYEVVVYDVAGNAAAAPFHVIRDVGNPTAPSNPRVNGGDAWIHSNSATLCWDPATDAESGVRYYAVDFADDPTPTHPTTSENCRSDTWSGGDTTAAPFYVRARVPFRYAAGMLRKQRRQLGTGRPRHHRRGHHAARIQHHLGAPVRQRRRHHPHLASSRCSLRRGPDPTVVPA